MARLHKSPSFDPNKPVYVRRSFRGDGRYWPIGARFNWKHLTVNDRRVAQLYSAGRLTHDVPSDKPGADAPDSADVGAGVVTDELETVETPEHTGDTSESDELDAIDAMSELRKIAKKEGAPLKTSKANQRISIRQNRVNGL